MCGQYISRNNDVDGYWGIGDKLYSMSMNLIKVSELFDPGTLMAELSLADLG